MFFSATLSLRALVAKNAILYILYYYCHEDTKTHHPKSR